MAVGLFGLEQLVMVGDRGMISQQAIDALRETDGIGWITALKSVSIRALVEQGQLQIGSFDERNPRWPSQTSPPVAGSNSPTCRGGGTRGTSAGSYQSGRRTPSLRLSN